MDHDNMRQRTINTIRGNVRSDAEMSNALYSIAEALLYVGDQIGKSTKQKELVELGCVAMMKVNCLLNRLQQSEGEEL